MDVSATRKRLPKNLRSFSISLPKIVRTSNGLIKAKSKRIYLTSWKGCKLNDSFLRLFTFEGEAVLAFNPCEFAGNVGYVLVDCNCEKFKKKKYLESLTQTIKKRDEETC